jgi:hypothetical protein
METLDEKKMVLELKPLHGGSYTQLSLVGPVCSAPQKTALRRLMRMLSFWNGYPVRVVLFADGRTAYWLEEWCDVLATVPWRDHELEFRVAPSPDDQGDAK